MDNLEKLKFPIGRFSFPETISKEQIEAWIEDILQFPAQLRSTGSNFSEIQLDSVYRTGGWTIRQVIHHIGDSHLNGFIRFKLTLTEDCPTIKPYNENKWANLGDYDNYKIEDSLQFIENLHKRFVALLKSIHIESFDREYFHPEQNKNISLKKALAIFAWHGKHHLEHIKIALK